MELPVKPVAVRRADRHRHPPAMTAAATLVPQARLLEAALVETALLETELLEAALLRRIELARSLTRTEPASRQPRAHRFGCRGRRREREGRSQ